MTVQTDGDLTTKLEVLMGPMVNVALLEMLASNIESFLPEDEDEKVRRLSFLGRSGDGPKGEA